MSAPGPNNPPATARQKAAAPLPTDLARRPFRWAIKGRTKEADLFRATVRTLTAELPAEPTPTQDLLIGQAAWLQVHIAQLNGRALDGAGLSEGALRSLMQLHYLYARHLRDLGIGGATSPTAEAWGDVMARLGAPDGGDDA